MKNWQEKIVYQIWPRSFKDSNGDGIGDIKGIIQKLDYIKNLGVDLIWLSPIYKSSNKDYGYDIDDYYSINSEFGTMEDFDLLLLEAKKKDIGIIMDLVANHTSDQHEWFKMALSDVNSKYRDYYFFRDGKNGIEPNNWISVFGSSAWTKDEISGQYYLTMFTKNQCDLNWENKEVRDEIYKIMRYWLDKGIAGFRMDVINTISKMDGLPDKNPDKTGYQFPDDFIVSRPKTHEYIKEMRREVLEHYDCFTVGEGMLVTKDAVISYTNPDNNELDMMFHFDLHNLGCGPLGKFDFRKFYRYTTLDFKNVINDWQTKMQENNAWIGNYLSNHDQPRHVSRFGDDKKYRIQSAKALALLNMTLRGSVYIYQGEEIGMTNCKLKYNEWRDYEALNIYKTLQSMMHLPKFIAKRIIQKMSRDNARTPMQWNDLAYAGFSTVNPWIKVNPNYIDINVENDKKSNNSLINYYRSLIKFRKSHSTLTYGLFNPYALDNKDVIVYTRIDDKEKFLVLINLTKKQAKISLPEFKNKQLVCMFSTHQFKAFNEVLSFSPYEGIVYKIKN